MERKNLIVMIIVMCVAFSSQLAAEEVVGHSIFPGIETPHPYSKASEGTVVWSETIFHENAKWLKVHFSKFRLSDDDHVDLVDMNDMVVARINGSDVVNQKRSTFKIEKNGGKRVSFWSPTIIGNTVRVQLYRGNKNQSRYGFTIDEVGIGEKEVKQQIKRKDCPGSGLRGVMLFQKEETWYTCEGSLSHDADNHFIPDEFCMDYRDIVDTIEVRFFFKYIRSGDDNRYPMHYVYYCDESVNGGVDKNTGYLVLRSQYDRIYFHQYGRHLKNNLKLSSIYSDSDDYSQITIKDQDFLTGWKNSETLPSLERTEIEPSANDTVLEQNTCVEGPDNNQFNIHSKIDRSGRVYIVNYYTPLFYPYPWHPYCCDSQYLICDRFYSIFWWGNLNCSQNYNYCINYSSGPDPCYKFGVWGFSLLIYFLFW